MSKKTTRKPNQPTKSINLSFESRENKRTSKVELSSNSKPPIWDFSKVDNDGKFAFNPSRKDFQPEDLLNKLLSYSTMTWQKILMQTHDNGKSKHHYLSLDCLSKEAIERIEQKEFTEKTDLLFSFALNNKTRLIGFKDGVIFQAVWYDANHEFALSHKKHT